MEKKHTAESGGVFSIYYYDKLSRWSWLPSTSKTETHSVSEGRATGFNKKKLSVCCTLPPHSLANHCALGKACASLRSNLPRVSAAAPSAPLLAPGLGGREKEGGREGVCVWVSVCLCMLPVCGGDGVSFFFFLIRSSEWKPVRGRAPP